MDRRTIMIVEDDREIRSLLADFLQREGYETVCAEDGAALDRTLARTRPDLIVLDIMLPGEDGLSICRRLRARGGVTADAAAGPEDLFAVRDVRRAEIGPVAFRKRIGRGDEIENCAADQDDADETEHKADEPADHAPPLLAIDVQGFSPVRRPGPAAGENKAIRTGGKGRCG